MQVAKVELSRNLSISPEEARSHVSDLSSLGDWLTMHEGWRSDLPDELTVGTTIGRISSASRRRSRRHQVRVADEVKPLPNGCVFRLKIDLGGAPLIGPIGMAASRAVKGDIERSIKKFEELYS